MAKTEQSQGARPPLPHVAVATLCEHVMQERDGVYSLIRVIDTMTLPVAEGELRRFGLIPVTAFILLKSDEARGSYVFHVTGEGPSGSPGQPQMLTQPTRIELTGEEQGITLVVQLGVQPERFGLYWFNVYVNNQRLTRIPLRLRGPVPADSVPTSS